MKVMYTNADQFRNKLSEFHVRVKNEMPHIIGVCEVKLKNNISPLLASEFSMDDLNYEMILCNVEEKTEEVWYCILPGVLQREKLK